MKVERLLMTDMYVDIKTARSAELDWQKSAILGWRKHEPEFGLGNTNGSESGHWSARNCLPLRCSQSCESVALRFAPCP